MTPLASLFRAQRKGLGLTLQEVADRSGCCKSFIWEIEHGVSEPSVSKAAALAKTLRIPAKHIFDAALEKAKP